MWGVKQGDVTLIPVVYVALPVEARLSSDDVLVNISGTHSVYDGVYTVGTVEEDLISKRDGTVAIALRGIEWQSYPRSLGTVGIAVRHVDPPDATEVYEEYVTNMMLNPMCVLIAFTLVGICAAVTAEILA